MIFTSTQFGSHQRRDAYSAHVKLSDLCALCLSRRCFSFVRMMNNSSHQRCRLSTCFMARRFVKMTPVIQLQLNYSYFQKDTELLLNNLSKLFGVGKTSNSQRRRPRRPRRPRIQFMTLFQKLHFKQMIRSTLNGQGVCRRRRLEGMRPGKVAAP